MAAGALAESAPPQGANGSVYYAYDYGIYADGLDHGAALNALITAASLAGGGGHIILPDTGFVRSSVPIVMQSGIWLQGAGPQVSGIQLTNNSACDVLNYQCYVPTATTWTDAAVAAISGTDKKLVRGNIALSGSSILGTHTTAFSTGGGAVLNGGPVAAGATQTLYGVLTANGSLTNNFATTTDLTVCVDVLQFP